MGLLQREGGEEGRGKGREGEGEWKGRGGGRDGNVEARPPNILA